MLPAGSPSANPALSTPRLPDEKRWQFADTITLALQDHIIKSGFDFSRVNSLQDTLLYEGGSYTTQPQ